MRARLPLLVVLVALLGQVGLGWLACDAVERGLETDTVAPSAVVAACADAGGGAPDDPCEHGPVRGERAAGAVVRALDIPPVGYVLAPVRVTVPARVDAPPVPAAVRAPVAVLGVDRS